MYLAENGIIPPEEFKHEPNIKRKDNDYTVAHYLACNGIIPPKEW